MPAGSKPSSLSPAVKRDLRDFLKACLQLVQVGLLVLLVNLVCYVQIRFSLPFETLLEWVQDIFLLIIAGIYTHLAWRFHRERAGLALIAGLFWCMLIREQDVYLNYDDLPGWQLLVLLLLSALAILVVRAGFEETLRGLMQFIRSQAFPLMLAGLATLLVFSRLIGWHGMWRWYFPADPELHYVCRICEETLELFGYALILVATLCYRAARR